jgi:hypothetical protein
MKQINRDALLFAFVALIASWFWPEHAWAWGLVALHTTAVANSFKVEVMQAAHCLNAPQTLACTSTTTATVPGLASTAGISVGMAVSGTNWPAGVTVKSVDSATQITTSAAPTAAVTSITVTGDALKILLVKTTPTRTYDGTQSNVGTPGIGTPGVANVGTDETSGTGYTSGGAALTNVTPVLSTATAIADFNPDPSWTSASFSCTDAIIYNTTTRLGGAAAPLNGRVLSNHDLGGTQTVTSGTLTLVMPTPDASNAIIRIG